MKSVIKFITKHIGIVITALIGVVASIVSFFIGGNIEKKRCEKELKKYQVILQKNEAELEALENAQRLRLRDKKRMRELQKENAELRKQMKVRERRIAEMEAKNDGR
jgi:uncharacterized protein HemX